MNETRQWEESAAQVRSIARVIRNGGTRLTQDTGVALDAAATLIENQGREIAGLRGVLDVMTRTAEAAERDHQRWRAMSERYREALTEVLRTNVEHGHPNKGSDEAGAGCPWCAAFNRVSTALQSPTQAPLQGGAE